MNYQLIIYIEENIEREFYEIYHFNFQLCRGPVAYRR